MPLRDRIKSPMASPMASPMTSPRSISVFSPISITNSPSNNIMCINSDDIKIIQWYINTRLANDTNGKDLLSIIFDNTTNTKYSDISPIFLGEFKTFLENYGLTKGGANNYIMENVVIRGTDENIDIEKYKHCIKFFFNEVLTFLGKKVEYNNIIINNF